MVRQVIPEHGWTMLRKIISGGKAGADRAALDVAIKMNIPHGGWIPKGRRTEKGPLPSKYLLQEMQSSSYAERTEKNVIDADGTVIFSHGTLTGGSELTRHLAHKHRRPCLHFDLNRVIAFNAAQQLNSWLQDNQIEVLNVAGTRGSHDPRIYRATTDVLQTAFYMEIIDGSGPNNHPQPSLLGMPQRHHRLPSTVDQAVNLMLSELSFKDKSKIANVSEKNVSHLLDWFGTNTQQFLGLAGDNMKLLQDCRDITGKATIGVDAAALMILKRIWKKLRTQKNVIRIVK